MNSQKVAELYAAGAIENYHEHGNVAAQLILHGPSPVIIQLSQYAIDEYGIQSASAELTLMIGALMEEPPTHVVTIMEAWVKYEPSPSKDLTEEEFEELARAEGERYKRGDLAKEREGGNTEVHTSIVVAAFDVEIPRDASHCVMYDMDRGAERTDHPGRQYGGIADHIERALDALPEARASKPKDTSVVVGLAMLQDLIDVAAVQERD